MKSSVTINGPRDTKHSAAKGQQTGAGAGAFDLANRPLQCDACRGEDGAICGRGKTQKYVQNESKSSSRRKRQDDEEPAGLQSVIGQAK